MIDKESSRGRAALTPLEKLIYCVWVADYGMRNAGDLVSATDVYDRFQVEAASLAEQLGLRVTHSAFSLQTKDLEKHYFELLSGIVNEIVKQLDPKG